MWVIWKSEAVKRNLTFERKKKQTFKSKGEVSLGNPYRHPTAESFPSAPWFPLSWSKIGWRGWSPDPFPSLWPGLRIQDMNQAAQKPPEPNWGKVGSGGAGDQAYRLLVNICQAVGRLDISVLKHSNLISLSKLYLHDKSLFTMRSFLWLQLQYKCAPSSRDTRGCVHHLTLLQLFKVDTGSVTCRYANHVYMLSCKCLKCSIYAWYKQTPIAEAVTPLPGLFTSYLIEAMGSQTASQP